MKKIQILGTGCTKCKTLQANAEAAAQAAGIACEFEKITDIMKITQFGVMMTPALAIDGKVVGQGKVMSTEEIAKHLTT